MSFTYDPSTNLGKVRALIGDTVASSYRLEDADINVYLGLTSNDIYASAAMAARAIAGKLAFSAKSVSAGNYSENTTGQYKAYLELAEKLEEAGKNIPADAQAEIIVDDFSFKNIISNKVLRGEPLD